MYMFEQKKMATGLPISARSTRMFHSRFGQNKETGDHPGSRHTTSSSDAPQSLHHRTENSEYSLYVSQSSAIAHDFSRIPVHAQPTGRVEQETSGITGPAKKADTNCHSGCACQRAVAVDYDGAPEEAPVREEPAPQENPPEAIPMTDDKTCQLSSLAPTFKITTGSMKAQNLGGHSFGNTARLAAYYTPLKACKEKKVWKFSLTRLDVNARVDVQPASFTNHRSTKMINVESADDAAINGTNWNQAVSSLNPSGKVKISSTCSGVSYPQEITNYPRRRKFWSRKITLGHENFHLAEWTKIYRKELVTAENKLRAFTVSASVASSKADALTKANAQASKWFPKAYQDATAKYCATKEVDAYNRDASHYQKLVDGIRARAKKEKWK